MDEDTGIPEGSRAFRVHAYCFESPRFGPRLESRGRARKHAPGALRRGAAPGHGAQRLSRQHPLTGNPDRSRLRRGL